MHWTGEPSRRIFLRRIAAAGCAPLLPSLLCACDGDEDSAIASITAPPESALPEAALLADAPPLPEVEPIVRVRLARIARSPSRIEIDHTSGWLRISEVAGGEVQRGLNLGTPLMVHREAGEWRIEGADGLRMRVPGDASVDVSVPDGFTDAAPPPMRISDRTYPGALRFVPRSDTAEEAFDLVNHVALEEYLPGVLARELYPHWEEGCFEAQAVAARSFAAFESWFFASRRHFDLHNTTLSQVYQGATIDRKAHDAVVKTRGRMLSFMGALIPGYYSACCGGLSANATHAIGNHPVNDIAPLRSRRGPEACRSSSVYQWSLRQPGEEVVERLRRGGRDEALHMLRRLKRIEAITASQRAESGRPEHYAIVGQPDVEVEISAVKLHRLLQRRLPDEREAPRLRSSAIEFEINEGDVTFNGRGFGHGVGLCQYGAQTLAHQGASPTDILARFYPQAKILSAYASPGDAPARRHTQRNV